LIKDLGISTKQYIMKRKMNRFLQRTPRQGLDFCGILLLMCMLSISSRAQTDWSHLYQSDVGILEQEEANNDEMVMLSYNNDGGSSIGAGRTIMFRSMEDVSNPGSTALQVTLIDENGNVVNAPGASEFYKDNANNIALVPVAAAYNPSTTNAWGMAFYIVTGYTNTGDIWYILFDIDLNPIPNGWAPPTSLTPINATDNYVNTISHSTAGERLFVTDVCATTNNGNMSFAFTGKHAASTTATNAWQAMDLIGSTDNFVMELDVTAGTTDYYELDFSGPDYNAYSFPASIIEIPDGTNGGYFISGATWNTTPAVTDDDYNTTTQNHDFFYCRTPYNLSTAPAVPAPYSVYARQISGLLFNRMNAQHAVYDPINNGSIFIAGNYQDAAADEFGIFCDRITGVDLIAPSAGITPLGAIDLPTLRYQGGNFLFHYPNLEGIFSDMTGAAPPSGTRKRILGRLLHDLGVITPNAMTTNMPFIMDVNYNDITGTIADWTAPGAVNSNFYPRNSYAHPFHRNTENNYTFQLADAQQVAYNYNGFGTPGSNEIYHLGTLGIEPGSYSTPNNTAVLSADRSNAFNVTCAILPDVMVRGQLSIVPPLPNYAAVSGATPATNSGTISTDYNMAGAPFVQCQPGSEFTHIQAAADPLKVWATDGTIYWSGDISLIEQMEIYNAVGAKVQTLSAMDFYLMQYDIKNYASGMYIVKYKEAAQETKTIKFIN